MSRVEVCGSGKSGLWKAVVREKETNTAIPVAVAVLFFLNEFDTVKMCLLGPCFCEHVFSMVFAAVFNATVCFSSEL